MAAAVPIEVPTIKRVKGITATNKIINGIERKALTTMATLRFNAGIACTPPGAVKYSKIPRGKPTKAPTDQETSTIMRVSQKESTNKPIIALDIGQLLYDYTALAQILHCRLNTLYSTTNHHSKGPKSLALDFIDIAMQNIKIQLKLANHCG